MSPSQASDLPPTNVLIVDDNEQNIELLQAYLEEIDGIETSTAKNGIEALSAVAKNKPDLILLDIMMPKMSGYEVCKQIKSDAKTRNIPLIIITALNEASDYERGMESGADDFLTRPLDRADFVTRVRSLLRIKKLRGEFAQGDS